MNIPPIKLLSGRMIGDRYPAYMVAEIGSNHDGDLERAKMLVRLAKESGADAAKFQSFQVHELINQQCKVDKTWMEDPAWEILKKLSIPANWHAELKKEADKCGIDFLSTPFDLDRLQLLLDINVPALKIASGDLTYHELLKAAGRAGRPVFLSTGHATMGEVESALRILWEAGCKDIVVMHCISSYPTLCEDANLSGMVSMRHGFQVLVGYSDHTLSSSVAMGAVAQGACVIEKHFTDDKTRSGPDHPFAMNGEEFSRMVSQIRELEAALKDGAKTPRPTETLERIMARRAIYAKNDIPEGAILHRDMVKMVRHAYPTGIPVDRWEWLDGRMTVKSIAKDELIRWDMV